MAWHGTAIRPVRAGRAGPVWCRVAPARCSRPLELWRGTHKRPGDWQKRKCLASRLLQISSPIRSNARVPRWRRGRAICAESSARGEGQRSEQPRSGLTWSRQASRMPAAGGEEEEQEGRGHSQEKPRSVASSSEKPALRRAWKLAGVRLAGVRKGGALFHQPSRNSPMKVEPAWGGGLPRHHCTHPSCPCPSFPGQPFRPCAVYLPTRSGSFSLSLCFCSHRWGPQGRLIEGPTVPRNEPRLCRRWATRARPL